MGETVGRKAAIGWIIPMMFAGMLLRDIAVDRMGTEAEGLATFWYENGQKQAELHYQGREAAGL